MNGDSRLVEVGNAASFGPTLQRRQRNITSVNPIPVSRDEYLASVLIVEPADFAVPAS